MTSVHTTASAPSPGARCSAASPVREIHVPTGSSWMLPCSWTPRSMRASTIPLAASRGMSASMMSPTGTWLAPG